MDALTPSQKASLDGFLEERYSKHLFPFVRNEHPEQGKAKNIARSISAFFIERNFGVTAIEAAKCVYDDYDDFGVDAIYWEEKSGKTSLFLIQSKHKESENVKQPEILAFKQGVEKIINQDFSGFNKNFYHNKANIERVVEDADEIVLVIIHSGPGLNQHAQQAIQEFIRTVREDDCRIRPEHLDFGPKQIVQEMRHLNDKPKIDALIEFTKVQHVTLPWDTYIGIISLARLVELHNINGKYLYEKNIRSYLGHKTDVNSSIRKTLKESPSLFLYLNNGIAALCEDILPKGQSSGGNKFRKVKVRGISIINGAQTIATTAKFVQQNPECDVSAAKVTLTLIKAPADGGFGKQVTKARNHQNAVYESDFSALDDRQDEIRRDLALLGYKYIYKSGELVESISTSRILHIKNVALALSLFQIDPRIVVWARRESLILDPSSSQYQSIFNSSISAHQIANAHHYWVFGTSVLDDASNSTSGVERLVYKHGKFIILWIVAKRYYKQWQSLSKIIPTQSIGAIFSELIDEIRQEVYDEFIRSHGIKGPLAFFGNMSDAIGLMQKVMIQKFNLGTDPAISRLQGTVSSLDEYPKPLFDYLIKLAPNIGTLT